jgi:hypothetical protein
MLTNILEAKTMEFSNLEQGLEFLGSTRTRQMIVPSSSLEVTQEGILKTRGSCTGARIRAPLTDFSLDLLHDILRIPKTYARRLDPQLHATNINELLTKRVSPLVVITEENENPHVSAILSSQPVVIPHEVIVEHLAQRKLAGRVSFSPGYMEAKIVGQEAVEILPQDAFSIEGSIVNSQLGLRKWPFEISAFLTRLVCSNGMVTRRHMLTGKLGMWAQNPRRLAEYMDRHLEAALNVITCGLKGAITRMADTNVTDEEKKNLTEEVRRSAGVQFLEGLFEKAMTAYDCLNDITSLAHKLEDRERKRKLWILGGGMIERFMEGN